MAEVFTLCRLVKFFDSHLCIFGTLCVVSQSLWNRNGKFPIIHTPEKVRMSKIVMGCHCINSSFTETKKLSLTPRKPNVVLDTV